MSTTSAALDGLLDLAKVVVPPAFVYFGLRVTNRVSKKAEKRADQSADSTAENDARKVDQGAFDRITGALERRCTQLESDLESERALRKAAEERATQAELRAQRAERAAEECNLRVTDLERRMSPPT